MNALPIRTGPSFTVHVESERGAHQVYVKRHWPQGDDPTRHMAARFDDPGKAEVYALAQSEVHGDCAVIWHP